MRGLPHQTILNQNQLKAFTYRHFAWLPTKLTNKKYIWLRYYVALYRIIEKEDRYTIKNAYEYFPTLVIEYKYKPMPIKTRTSYETQDTKENKKLACR